MNARHRPSRRRVPFAAVATAVSMCALLTVAGAPAAVPGQQIFDNGQGTNDWFDNNNWSPNGAPLESNDLVIRGNHQVISYAPVTSENGSITVQELSGFAPTVTFNNNVTIGDQDVAELTVTAGTVNTNVDLYFGYNTNGDGTGLISGASTVLNYGGLYSGYWGTGDVTITDGARVDGGTFVAGRYGGANGTVTVTGAGSLLDTGLRTVGYSGVGRLEADLNGTITSTSTTYVGRNNGATGFLVAKNGGSIRNGGAQVGYNSGSTGWVFLGVGAGASTGGEWASSSTSYLGRSGTAHVQAFKGSTLNTGTAYVGYSASGVGNITLGGSGTRWTVGAAGNNTLVAGRAGFANIQVSSGAVIDPGNVVIGEQTGSSGSIVVGDVGTRLEAREITVGSFGTGSLTVEDGAVVIGTNLFVGRGANSGGGGIPPSGGTGTVTVSGASTRLLIDSLTLGNAAGTGAPTAVFNVFGSNTQIEIAGNVDIGHGGDYDDNAVTHVGGDFVVSRGDARFIRGANVDGDLTIMGTAVRGLFDSSVSTLGGFHFDQGRLQFASANTITVDGALAGSGELSRLDSGNIEFGGGVTLNLINGAFIDGINGQGMVLGGGSNINSVMELNIESGATVGRVSTSLTGTEVTVRGSGSRLDAGDLIVGENNWQRDSSLTIEQQATAGAGNVDIGQANPGTVNVNGSGARFDTGRITIGDGTDATLNINGGAVVASSIGYIGDQTWSGPDSVANVDGAGSAWQLSGNLTVARDESRGVLNITNGAVVSAGSSIVGDGANSGGLVDVSGAGSRFDVSGDLYLGIRGLGNIDLDNQAVATSGNTTLGILDDANGQIFLTNDSEWHSSGNLTLGGPDLAGSAGYLHVQSGSQVSTAGAVTLNDGVIAIRHAGSSWVVDGALDLGRSSNTANRISIRDGASALWSSSARFAFGETNALADLAVEGDGSTLSVLGTFTLGSSGGATATFADRADVNSGFSLVGAGSSAIGRATVTGQNTLWTTDTLVVGQFGHGDLLVEDRARVDAGGALLIGGFQGASGTVTVVDPISHLTGKGLIVGQGGDGTLVIANGGKVTINAIGESISVASIGHDTTGIGTVTVDGPTSRLTLNADALSLGTEGGEGLLTIRNDARVSVTGDLNIFADNTVRLERGTLVVGGIGKTTNILGESTDHGIFDWQRGELNVTGNFALDDRGPLGSSLTVDAFKTLDVDGELHIDTFNILTLSDGLLQAGSLDIDGVLDWQRGQIDITGVNGLVIGNASNAFTTLSTRDGNTLNVATELRVGAGGNLAIEGGVTTAGTTVVDNTGTLAVQRGVFDGGFRVTNRGTVALTDFGQARVRAIHFDNESGLVTGDGEVDLVGEFTNAANGEVRASNGQSIAIQSNLATNHGDVRLLGGTAEFRSTLENAADGFIAGRGTLIAEQINNDGVIAFSAGNADVFGDVNNRAGGRIITTGSGTTTFYDDVTHNGAEIRTSTDASLVLLGGLGGSGSFTGGGTIFFEGDLRPGNSPGYIDITGDAVFGVNLDSLFEIAGYDRGELAGPPVDGYDAVDISGELLVIGGILEIELINGFVPVAGDVFHIISASVINGSFESVILPEVQGLTFLLQNDGANLSVAAVPLPASVWMMLAALATLLTRHRSKSEAVKESTEA